MYFIYESHKATYQSITYYCYFLRLFRKNGSRIIFHHEGVHCDAKTEKHFHHVEHEQEDLVCTFNFSASSEVSNKNHLFFSFLNEKTIVSEYLTVFINKHTNKNTPLRGPPTA